jgi:NTE family protein
MTTTSRSPAGNADAASRQHVTAAADRPASAAPAESDLSVLVLQGGGALGAYQGGAFEALVSRAALEPDWVAGISIGAVNAALIAGNPPERRLERLRAFWTRLASGVPDRFFTAHPDPLLSFASDWSAAWSVGFGLPGFFTLRPGAALWPGPMPNPSFYDTAPLARTLEELVDFDRLNDGPTRISVGAVDVESGNFIYFDNRERRIGVEHVLASGALPPGFPAVPIGGHWYWDGGLVSNTPLEHVVERLEGEGSVTIFQVDLFSARGPLPRTHAEVEERLKDIRFSSRTRAITDKIAAQIDLHARIRSLAELLPPARRDDPEVRRLLADTRDPAITLVHLIYRQKAWLTQRKDYEFSRATIEEHWHTGLEDMRTSLARLDDAPPLSGCCQFRVFDWVERPAAAGVTAAAPAATATTPARR